MINKGKLEKELAALRSKKKEIEARLEEESKNSVLDPFALNSLKKQKLMVKESITRLENLLNPDVIA
jgi:hypothetical protein